MLNERLKVARAVAETLWATEHQIDASVTHAGTLIAAVAGAREDAKLAAVVTQDTLELLGGSMTALLHSRRQLVDAHARLDVIRSDMRLPTISWGDKVPLPPIPVAESEEAPVLKVVGA